MKTKSGDTLVLLVTFLLTVFVNLTVAVEFGLILAVILFTKRMSESVITEKVLPNPHSKTDKVDPTIVTDTHDCPQISIYNIEGPLFFGAAQTFEQKIMRTINYKPKVLILRMGKVPYIDTTGESYLSSIVNDFSKNGIVLITGLNQQPEKMLIKTGLSDIIGKEHFFERTGEAINYALAQLDVKKCSGCKHFAFRECVSLSKSDFKEAEEKRKLITSSS